MLLLDLLSFFVSTGPGLIDLSGTSIASAEGFGVAVLSDSGVGNAGPLTTIGGSNVVRRVFGSRRPYPRGSGWSGIR